MEKLSEDDQELLWGKYYFELSDAELADLFGCKPASIRMKLSRAKRRAMGVLKEGAFSYE